MIVVKRKGHKEKFDERKIYGSVYAACSSADYNESQCEKIAKNVTKKVKISIKSKEISSTYISKTVIKELKAKNKELAFFYEQHLPNLKKL